MQKQQQNNIQLQQQKHQQQHQQNLKLQQQQQQQQQAQHQKKKEKIDEVDSKMSEMSEDEKISQPLQRYRTRPTTPMRLMRATIDNDSDFEDIFDLTLDEVDNMHESAMKALLRELVANKRHKFRRRYNRGVKSFNSRVRNHELSVHRTPMKHSASVRATAPYCKSATGKYLKMASKMIWPILCVATAYAGHVNCYNYIYSSIAPAFFNF